VATYPALRDLGGTEALPKRHAASTWARVGRPYLDFSPSGSGHSTISTCPQSMHRNRRTAGSLWSSQGNCLTSFMRAPHRDDRSASSLAGRPCLIIRVRECRHETGNIVLRASVEATLVVGDRARVRRFRRILSIRISGRPTQTAAALAGACGQAASHPRIGGKSVPSPGLSEQASN
jgi:hypothetical protein